MLSLFRRRSEEGEVREAGSGFRLDWMQTDMHCHILPGIDDGAPDVEASIALLEQYNSMGIDRFIATPHVKQSMFPNTPATIRAAWERLAEACIRKGINVHIQYSAEYYLDEGFLEALRSDQLLPLPGNYLLIEVSFSRRPMIDLGEVARSVMDKGFFPILAHPERYRYWYKNLNKFETLKSQGWLLQVNLLSLAGYYGSPEQKMARILLDNELVDFIGTDTHKPDHLYHIESSGKDPWVQRASEIYLMNKFLELDGK
ncbi:protein-tyrosine phosphatase [Anseongella ginsenosidimutans]|uniref:protein-tyrosine-phosphatase n=1 Tax=Anseongella ginsenosidimutans TaxID=496056 RepID=A0A4R3KLA7_9SPHI|nr:CpsB/CapC family capsule biosynthesis tyrosine phosphatase [Anseongella ginsenosidimutans]QEC52125.1 hypothetical protein FRZ59_07110 [Anseongella ginsenosidimutans]TCS84846.1 protein-tyrosine phosphatase [Anseongella ginsenosidimutans]